MKGPLNVGEGWFVRSMTETNGHLFGWIICHGLGVFYGHGIFLINFGVFRFSLNFAMSSFSVHEVQQIGINNLFEI